MTPDLEDEWDRRQSNFAAEWRVAMETEGLVCGVSPVNDQNLRRRILSTAQSTNKCRTLKKDLHLIEAAKATDDTVSSLDKKVKDLLREAAHVVREIRAIIWVNPEREEDDPILWLKRGAPADPDLKLGCASSA